jgi:5-hydroxyisourate hydrolase
MHRLETYAAHIQPSQAKPSTAPAKGPITTHILDTSRGLPASGVPVALAFLGPSSISKSSAESVQIGQGVTDADGRVATLLSPTHELQPGFYRITFNTGQYFESTGEKEYFYPQATIDFVVKNTKQHYHVPLLLNPFGFSTYRGS